MKSLWSETDAKSYVARYGDKGIAPDLALRVYTTRLLGGDPALVLHGGGNTSVKTKAKDLLGDQLDVICVKGSGWDMGDIEPPGLPAVKLAPLRRLLALEKLSDEDMVNYQRVNLLDSAAPNPSVETLLHAFLPHKFVDHTHSTAVLALTDQPDGEAIARDTFGTRMAYVPYTIPGFALAKSVAEIYAANPKVEGLILLRHGIFTFAEGAREAYELMIEMVTLAEERLKRGKKTSGSGEPAARGSHPSQKSRRCCAARARSSTTATRVSPSARSSASAATRRFFAMSTARSSRVIRNRAWRRPITRSAPRTGRSSFPRPKRTNSANGKKQRAPRLMRSSRSITPISPTTTNGLNGAKKELDPFPRVILVPGVGLFGLGASAKDAAIAADIAENTVDVITDAEHMSSYRPISEEDQFDVEYWSLEQAKLGKAAEKRLARQVAVVTGGGSGIGAATAKAMAREGAEIAVLDRDLEAARAIAKQIGGHALGLACDVTKGRRRPPRVRRGGGKIRRGRHRRLECGRRLAGPHRRGR